VQRRGLVAAAAASILLAAGDITSESCGKHPSRASALPTWAAGPRKNLQARGDLVGAGLPATRGSGHACLGLGCREHPFARERAPTQDRACGDFVGAGLPADPRQRAARLGLGCREHPFARERAPTQDRACGDFVGAGLPANPRQRACLPVGSVAASTLRSL